ncbi:hypothetical protein [Cereibacter sphaeroides]|uniref:hypothetical protein n=1 Tax=Cereibacter sphaeroides TaxID=1063 RepID=UPI001F45CFCF|nr:hypothetical protein [Cereibacter sphaeroides]
MILATGHVFPDADEATRSYFPSPWSGLIQAEVPPVSVGIMGTSLSSIDAAMAVANQHGRFRRHGEELTFEPATEGLHLAAIPYLMHDRPFVQGITASAEIGATIARGISQAVGAEERKAASDPDHAGGMVSMAHCAEA